MDRPDPQATNRYMESLPECSAAEAVHAVAFFFNIPESLARQLVLEADDFVWHEDL